MYITNEVREEAHTQLGIDFNEKDFESRIKVEEEKSFSNGHNYNANEADDPLENNRMNRRMSAAGEALKALTVEEEIDIYRSAATLAANEDVANKTMKDERSLADSSNIRNDEDLITSETGSDERNNDIISTAVADAELAVKETAKRIIHASRMRCERAVLFLILSIVHVSYFAFSASSIIILCKIILYVTYSPYLIHPLDLRNISKWSLT